MSLIHPESNAEYYWVYSHAFWADWLWDTQKELRNALILGTPQKGQKVKLIKKV